MTPPMLVRIADNPYFRFALGLFVLLVGIVPFVLGFFGAFVAMGWGAGYELAERIIDGLNARNVARARGRAAGKRGRT